MTVVWLRAVDWNSYLAEQLSIDTKWEVAWCEIVGFLVAEDDEKVVLAMQDFDNGDCRGVVAIPKVCISERKNL